MIFIFGDFFTYMKHLISGNTEALAKFRELKAMYRTFKPSKRRYLTKEKEVTELFLSRIFALYKSISVFRSILESTIFSFDEKKAALFLNYYIESFLPEEIRYKKEKYLKEEMLKKMQESDNPNAFMKQIEGDFNMFRKFFISSNMPKVETEYFLLYRINSLATFNFELFFSKFDPTYKIAEGKPPSYNIVSGKEVLNELKDLYFLLAQLPKRVDLTSSFKKLFSRISDMDEKRISKDSNSAVDEIYKYMGAELSPALILTMVRYIEENPKLKIPLEQKDTSILEKYRNDLTEWFGRNKDFVLQKYSEDSLQSDINALLGKTPLMPIEGYTPEFVKLLTTGNNDVITGIQGMRITKTFIMELYERKMKDIINVLVIEGFFLEKDFQTELSDCFFEVNELKNFCHDAEMNLANGSSNSMKTLEVLLGARSKNDNKIKMNIEIVNQKIMGYSRKVSISIYKLGTKLFEILKDYKSNKPLKIQNIKKIKEDRNKQYISKLANTYTSIVNYIKLIKNFVKVDK